jgi:pyruvate/2-oxoglutarate/acetoin dehydrogenase E1 component
MAEVAREALLQLAYEHEIFAEMIVATQLCPFELDLLQDHTAKTMKLLTLEEGSLNLGWGAEIGARMVEMLGGGLRFKRVAARNIPIAAAAKLEADILPQVEDIVEAARALIQDQGSLE